MGRGDKPRQKEQRQAGSESPWRWQGDKQLNHGSLDKPQSKAGGRGRQKSSLSLFQLKTREQGEGRNGGIALWERCIRGHAAI